jgi:CheY-like chemotaxis protein
MEARVKTHRSVLIVEDYPDGAESTAAVLGLCGYEVRVALTPREALRLAAESAPDVVVLDIGLPQMDGYELARQIRAAAGRDPVLVALTGFGHLDDRSRAEGFRYHFLKPVDPVELARALAACTADDPAPVAAS